MHKLFCLALGALLINSTITFAESDFALPAPAPLPAIIGPQGSDNSRFDVDCAECHSSSPQKIKSAWTEQRSHLADLIDKRNTAYKKADYVTVLSIDSQIYKAKMTILMLEEALLRLQLKHERSQCSSRSSSESKGNHAKTSNEGENGIRMDGAKAD